MALTRPIVRRRAPIVIVIAILALVLAGEVGVAGVNRAYAARALPGTSVAGVDVGGLDRDQIAAKVAALPPPSSITVTYSSTAVPLDVATLGLKLDPQASADLAVRAGRSGSQLGTLAALRGTRTEQVVVADNAALQAALDKEFGTVLRPAHEPTAHFDDKAGRFVLQPGAPGERLSAPSVLAELSRHWRSGGPVTVAAGTIGSAPTTSNVAADDALAAANAMVGSDLVAQVGPEQITIPKATLAGFLQLRKKNGAPFSPVIDTAAIRTYVSTLRRHVERPKADAVKLTRGGRTVLTIDGQSGLQLADTNKVANQIQAALAKHDGTRVTLPVTETRPGTRSVPDGERSVDVSLSRQTLTLKVDGRAVRSYVISSGKPSTPTVQGTFKVWHKTTKQDMTGGTGPSAYVLKDVKWNSFFKGNYAFHTANWHDDFGTPVSHGCVNMREQDAKNAYYFAPIGTTVSVHP